MADCAPALDGFVLAAVGDELFWVGVWGGVSFTRVLVFGTFADFVEAPEIVLRSAVLGLYQLFLPCRIFEYVLVYPPDIPTLLLTLWVSVWRGSKEFP